MPFTLFQARLTRSMRPLALVCLCMSAQSALAGPLSDAISGATPTANARLRYETVSQSNRAEDANSVTFRLRAGFKTAPVHNTTVGLEFEWVESLNGDFNSTRNGQTQFPVVADPQDVEVNQLYVKNTALPGTELTLGRQRIVFDDARFIGDVVWRQNQQTYDALRITNTAIEGLTINGVYAQQVNRIFGRGSSMGRFNGENIFLNAAYNTPIGKLTGFFYVVDPEEALALSTKTFGARLLGDQKLGDVTVKYAASYARQVDHSTNPFDVGTDYYNAELTGVYQGFAITAAYEVLGSDGGVRGFATPYATAHKFQGFADLFLATPNTGVRDLNVRAGYTRKNVGPFSVVKGSIRYHQFDSDFGNLDYGDEVDFVISAKYKRFLFLAKFGEYNANQFGADTRRLTFDVNFAF